MGRLLLEKRLEASRARMREGEGTRGKITFAGFFLPMMKP